MSGGKLGATYRRRNARHWLWQVAFETETPELEMNDVGRFNTGDGTVVNGRLQYRETVPGRWYRDYSLVMNTRHEWNFGGEMQVNQITPDLFMTLPNFWEVEVGGAFAPAIQDERLTRGGPSMEKPGSWQVTTELSSSEAAETQGEVAFEYGRTEDGGLTFVVDSELTMQPSSAVAAVDQPRVRAGGQHAAVRVHA